MTVPFCWSHKSCRDACPVKDLKILFCWKYFDEEAAAGLKPCSGCGYRESWEMIAAGIPRPTDQPPAGNRTRTILVVDDEPNILYALEETVRNKGYECVAAADGEQGLIIARAIHPDLIISDIIMPKMSGIELCYTLKCDEATRAIPIILVTVRTTEKERMEGDLAGADAYITKPFSSAHLRTKIEQLLQD